MYEAITKPRKISGEATMNGPDPKNGSPANACNAAAAGELEEESGISPLLQQGHAGDHAHDRAQDLPHAKHV
jgi:hypothetical protein